MFRLSSSNLLPESRRSEKGMIKGTSILDDTFSLPDVMHLEDALDGR